MFKHRWVRLLTQQTLITVELADQEKQTSDFPFFPFAENKQKFAVSLLHQTMEFAIFR
jgi:hypothetical protein